MEKERRKHKRINKTMAVQIEDSYGIVIDLSQGGLRIIPDALPKKIEDIRISFITEDGEPIELRGAVVRIVDRKKKEGKYELGLAIPKSPENYRKYIEALEKDESPSGIFQENVRQDLVEAVLKGKEENLSIPKSEAPPPPPAPYEAVEENNLNIPIEELLQEEPEADFPETPGPAPQEHTPDETIVMPANRLPYQVPQTADTGTSSSGKKKAAPQRVEISFEEFLQKNPQFNKPAGPSSPAQVPPTEDEESLDRVFKESPQPGPSLTKPEQEIDPSLNGIFKENTQPHPIPKTDKEQEEDMSLDKIFKEQDKS
ncbi:MAG: PilZ domain-containing protein [Candidatus Aminicenantes bacterium]|nr:PilZ domain-containing protein [Candidatus Aminicenantes bacterium]